MFFSVNGSGSYEFCQGFGDFVLWVKIVTTMVMFVMMKTNMKVMVMMTG